MRLTIIDSDGIENWCCVLCNALKKNPVTLIIKEKECSWQSDVAGDSVHKLLLVAPSFESPSFSPCYFPKSYVHRLYLDGIRNRDLRIAREQMSHRLTIEHAR